MLGYSQDNGLKIEGKRNNDNSVTFYYEKKYPGAITVDFKFSDLRNTFYSGFPKVLTGPSGQALTLKPKDENQGISYSMTYSMIKGKIDPKIKDNLIYILPLTIGKEVEVIDLSEVGHQYFGKKKPLDWKAFLFRTQGKTDIHASRKGIVVNLEENFDGNHTASFVRNRNRVVIEHRDGSQSEYQGFAKGGIIVGIGDYVFPTQALGKADYDEENQRSSVWFTTYVYRGAHRFEEYKKNAQDKTVTQYINPLFATSAGNERLVENKLYQVVAPPRIIEKEMTKKEKKRFNKKS